MRILMLAPSPNVRGPIGKHTLHLVEGLESLGCTVDLRTWGRTGDHDSIVRRGVSRFTDALRIRRLLREVPYDVFVLKTAHDWSSLGRDVLLLALCRRSPQPVVLQLHGSQPVRLWRRSAVVYRSASRLLARMVNSVLVLSSDEQRAWSKLVPWQDVRVVANPYISKLHGTVAGSSRSNSHPTILFVGRFIKQKGVFELLDATAQLGNLSPRLVLVGDGPEREALQHRAQTLGLTIEMPGYLEGASLAAQYRSANVFVLASWSEGFPTVIAEAMDAGLPIVTTRQQGMADHLVEAVNALFVAPRNPSSLAGALRELLADEGLRKRMGEANRKKVEEFAPHGVAGEYFGILQDVVRHAESAASSRPK